MTLKRGCPLTEMGASFQIKLRYQNPHKQVVKLLAVIYATKAACVPPKYQIEILTIWFPCVARNGHRWLLCLQVA